MKIAVSKFPHKYKFYKQIALTKSFEYKQIWPMNQRLRRQKLFLITPPAHLAQSWSFTLHLLHSEIPGRQQAQCSRALGFESEREATIPFCIFPALRMFILVNCTFHILVPYSHHIFTMKNQR